MVTPPDARVVRLECDVHGHLWDETAYCHHDTQDVVRKVLDAHRPTFGADCDATVTVELLDPETMEPAETPSRHSYLPPHNDGSGADA